MTILKHELRQKKISFIIWTASIGFLMAVCVFLFPEMKNEMGSMGAIFANMGAFTEAFGMDKLNFGTLIGFYAIECGNILGLGGAFFASLCAVNVLSKEEKDGTAEFLLAHPVSRKRIVAEKLAAVLAEITAMNLIVYLLGLGCIFAVGEKLPWKELNLLHLAYYLMQLEIAGICFGISAFLRRGSLGIGLGISAMLYFLSLVANIAKPAEFLNYITPFGYTDGAGIVGDQSLDGVKVAIGIAVGVLGIVLAYTKYCKKDIYS